MRVRYYKGTNCGYTANNDNEDDIIAATLTHVEDEIISMFATTQKPNERIEIGLLTP